MLKPNDLGKILSLDMLTCIKIDDVVRETNRSLKRAILGARLEEFGQDIQLTTTKTRFGGERNWFVCPSCTKRVGVLYLSPGKRVLKCRGCLQLPYFKQKFKVG